MRVIGTAGHVDHGKSTLVEALTGIDPDRLKEEKNRGMTIDLGFAWMSLPLMAGESTTVGIVDVPGHIDFIKNMLAGVGGIDAALLVIAADEGIMPQTREHLAILDLLEVPALLVALTKIDAAEDDEWIELVELDILDLLDSTRYADTTIQRVSALQGEGLTELRSSLANLLTELPLQRELGQPRLPIDRVFSLSGFGTIVTGTLQDGHFHTGDAVEILPANLSARIRGIQSHHTALDKAAPGSRVALNLTGVGTDELHRGDVVAKPGILKPTHLIDVRFRLLASAPQPLRHNQLVEFYCGASEVLAHVRLLGKEQLIPGDEGWLQLRLQEPVVVAQGNRYILRRPSPSETLGGGAVLNAHPRRRWRRFDETVLQQFATLAEGNPDDILLQTLQHAPFSTAEEIEQASGLDQRVTSTHLNALLARGEIHTLGDETAANLVTKQSWQVVIDALGSLLSTYHTANPLRRGMPRGEVRSRLAELLRNVSLDVRLFNLIVNQAEQEAAIVTNQTLLWLRGFKPELDAKQIAQIKAALDRLDAAGIEALSVGDVVELLGNDKALFDYLLDDQQIVVVGQTLVYLYGQFERCVADVRQHIEVEGAITLAEARDLWQTSRKYAQALLEEMDARRITRRVGDIRQLARN